MITFYLVRHGQTDANARGIRPGDLPFTLNELGRKQAARTGEVLAEVPLDVVYSSDYLRTIETAGFIMEHQSCSLEFDPRLRDVQQGELLGLTAAEIDARFPHLSAETNRDPFNTRRPGGESFADCAVRVWDFTLEKAALWSTARSGKAGDINICVITHGGVINAVATQVTSTYFPKIVGNCSITVVRYCDGQWTLERMDDVSHLA